MNAPFRRATLLRCIVTALHISYTSILDLYLSCVCIVRLLTHQHPTSWSSQSHAPDKASCFFVILFFSIKQSPLETLPTPLLIMFGSRSVSPSPRTIQPCYVTRRMLPRRHDGQREFTHFAPTLHYSIVPTYRRTPGELKARGLVRSNNNAHQTLNAICVHDRCAHEPHCVIFAPFLA